jgi:HEPN domain-containing protein
MPHDPARVADARAWLVKADEDLRAGAHQLSATPPYVADAVFHAQQACGMAMKGFLSWNDRPFGKTHNLVELGRACADLAPELEGSLRQAGPLTEYAWRFRYPGEPEGPPAEEAVRALEVARGAVSAILAKLPPEVRP